MKNVEVKRGVSYSYDIGIEMLVNIIFGSKFVSIRLKLKDAKLNMTCQHETDWIFQVQVLKNI